MTISESPATQSRSFRFGENASLFGSGCAEGAAGLVGVAGGSRGRWGSREGDFRVDLVRPRAPDDRLYALSRPVEEQGVADAGEGAGEDERDVALPAVGLVVSGLVHAGRVEEQPDGERKDADDEGVAGAPLPPARALLVGAPPAVLVRALARRRRSSGLLERARLVVGQRGERGQLGRLVGHQNWK